MLLTLLLWAMVSMLLYSIYLGAVSTGTSFGTTYRRLREPHRH